MRAQLIHHLEQAHEMLSHQPKDVGLAKVIEMVLKELRTEFLGDAPTLQKVDNTFFVLPAHNVLSKYLLNTALYRQYGF